MRINDAALIVIDVQKAFDDADFNGPRNNPEADANIARLIGGARTAEIPLILVQHASREAGSLLDPRSPGFAFKDYIDPSQAAVIVRKSVHSSFLGEPDLGVWLQKTGIRRIVIAGITTNFCCETTARMGSNLGFDVDFVLDATHTFDLDGPDGRIFTAQHLADVTAVNLSHEFARVTTTDAILAEF